MGVGLGIVDPDRGVPYYLLVAGTPEEIPFEFQTVLGLQWLVGRLGFGHIENYANYARSVVGSESMPGEPRPSAVVFGVVNPDDGWSAHAGEFLTEPLSSLSNARTGADTTKSGLSELLREDGWNVLFTVSHGLVFPDGHLLQSEEQGAVVCGNWPGPGAGPLIAEQYFAGSDVPKNAKLLGRITVHVASYSAGTYQPGSPLAPEITPIPPFVSGLSTAMLARPGGGSLAFIGHIGRVMSYSQPSRPSRQSTHRRVNPLICTKTSWRDC
jgi:hypothetical protein